MKSWLIFVILLIFPPSTTFQTTSTENITLQLAKSRISENDEPAIDIGGKCGGKVIAFHLPERGWFVFTLAPYAGYNFRKNAKVNGKQISFSLDDRKYEITSAEAICPEAQSLDIWVARVPPPADKADTIGNAISCFSDFNLWEKTVLKKDKKQ